MRKQRNTALFILSVIAAVLAVGIYFNRRSKPDGMKPPAKTPAIPQISGEDSEENELLRLFSLNGNTVGYLSVKNTNLGTVVVQGKNNDFYSRHDFLMKPDAGGCPYADAAADLSEPSASNTAIFGSGLVEQPFGFLCRYLELDFLKENPVLCFETLARGMEEYEIVSVCYADVNDETGPLLFSRTTGFTSDGSFMEFAVSLKLYSIFTTPAVPKETDCFLTLVAAIEDWEGASLVIAARRTAAQSVSEIEETAENEGAVYPNGWYTAKGLKSSIDYSAERTKWMVRLGFTVPPEEKPLTIKVPTVDDSQAKEIIGKPVDTSEGTGTQGPSVSTSNGNNVEYITGEGLITVTSASTGKQISGTPAEIVSMIVEAEVGSSFHTEAIKAQAVAVITYLKYSYGSSAAPSVPLKTASTTVRKCVDEVINTGMFYNGSIIYSPYCSSMAGRSNACHEVWVQNLPYLVSVESKYDKEISGFTKTYTYSEKEMRRILEEYYEIKLSDNPGNWIKVIDYTSGGYVGNMSIDDRYSTTGSRFRANCMYIRSAAFTCTYDGETGIFTIVTSGYGHGVGMSQYGANFYALREGMTYLEILSHYYTGVTFGTVSW